jgi:hypothetical protein
MKLTEKSSSSAKGEKAGTELDYEYNFVFRNKDVFLPSIGY